MRGGGAVSHPGVGNVGGDEPPLTDSRSQALRDSGNAEGPIALGLRPPIQSEPANHGGSGAGPGLAVVDPTWDCGAITQAEGGKKRKSNLRKEETHGGGGVRSEGGVEGGRRSVLLLTGSSKWCDRRLHLRSGQVREERSALRESWIYSTASRQVFRTDFGRSRRSALRDRCSATIPARHDLLITATTS